MALTPQQQAYFDRFMLGGGGTWKDSRNLATGFLLGGGVAGGLGSEAVGSTVTGTDPNYGQALGVDLAGLAAGAGISALAPGAGATGAGAAGADAVAGVGAAEAGAGMEGVYGGGYGGGAGTGGAAATGGIGSTLTSIANHPVTKMALSALPAALGAYGAKQQQNSYEGLAREYMAMGEPYRSRLEALYADPNSFLNSPEVQAPIQQGTDMLARSLSTQGNPVGSGNALQQLQNYASTQLFSRLGQEKDRLAGFGGLSSYNQAAPGAAGSAIDANRGVYDALGAGAADVFNPPKSLAQILKELKAVA